jgi:hypothetical protein
MPALARVTMWWRGWGSCVGDGVSMRVEVAAVDPPRLVTGAVD